MQQLYIILQVASSTQSISFDNYLWIYMRSFHGIRLHDSTLSWLC